MSWLPVLFHKRAGSTAELGAVRQHGEKLGSLLPQEATLCPSLGEPQGRSLSAGLQAPPRRAAGRLVSPLHLPERREVRWVRPGPGTSLRIRWLNPQRKGFRAELRNRLRASQGRGPHRWSEHSATVWRPRRRGCPAALCSPAGGTKPTVSQDGCHQQPMLPGRPRREPPRQLRSRPRALLPTLPRWRDPAEVRGHFPAVVWLPPLTRPSLSSDRKVRVPSRAPGALAVLSRLRPLPPSLWQPQKASPAHFRRPLSQ